MRRPSVVMLVLALAAVPLLARQLQTPTDWRWRTDGPATLVTGQDVPADAWRFVAMPPGWHVTTGPGALLYPAGRRAEGLFVLQAEIFLFPGESQQEYGLFLGGRNLEPEGATPQYLAFVARRDGQAAILKRGASGVEPLVTWKANDAVLTHTGAGTAKNVLRVEVSAADIAFAANGKDIARIPRGELVTDGTFGFRVGKDVNLHISTLDVTHRLAPVPIKES